MPHCVIEITEKIIQKLDTSSLMKDSAQAIYSLNCFQANDIKVRLIPIEYSFMGIEEEDHAFVAAEIFIFDNKTKEQVNLLSDTLQAVLEKHCKSFHPKLSITTRISFLNEHYKRFKTI